MNADWLREIIRRREQLVKTARREQQLIALLREQLFIDVILHQLEELAQRVATLEREHLIKILPPMGATYNTADLKARDAELNL